jgi:hypothetical protein
MKNLSRKSNWRYVIGRLTHKQFLTVMLIILTTGFQTIQGQVTKKEKKKK